MVKKKAVKKTVALKKKKKVSKSEKINNAKKTPFISFIPQGQIPAKMNLALRKLILFAALFIISYILYGISSNELLSNVFWMLALITGFIALAFFIAWLVFIMIKVERK